MGKSPSISLTLMLGLALAVSNPTQASAGQTLPAAPNAVLVGSSNRVTAPDCDAGQMTIDLVNSGSLTSVTSEYSWLNASIADGRLSLSFTENPNAGVRTCRVYLNRTGFTSSVLTFDQPGTPFTAELAQLIPDNSVVPTSAWASSYQADREIEKSFDGNTGTIYHSNFSGFKPADETTWPILEYYFATSFNLGAINYIPVQAGNGNGRFGIVDIYVRSDGDDDYRFVMQQDYKQAATSTQVTIPEEYGTNVNAVRFVVRTGKHHGGSAYGFASCAEMQFKKRTITAADRDVFTDDIYSALRDGVTLTEINQMQNPMLRDLATSMYTGQYSSAGRVSTHKPLMALAELKNQLLAYGAYDAYQGATGVVIGKGTNIFIVSGIPDSKGSVTLQIRSWLPTNDQSESYTLTNGINVINKTTDVNGLAYLSNYYSSSDLNSGNCADVKIHIVNGAVNGVLRPTLSNEENQSIIDNACHGVIDLVGSHAHCIWETSAIGTYAKGQYVRYMNIIDQLMIWIHRMTGIEKYNLCSANVSLVFCCNYNYMTQTGTGIAMNMSTQSRLCNPDALMNTDSDAIWGLSHEWGHQHQMAPYLRWPGTWEVTNNLNAIYNFLRMGYYSRVESSRTSAVNMMLNDTHSVTTSTMRQNAVNYATTGTTYDWCEALKAFAASQSTTVTSYADDKDHALSIFEAGIDRYMILFYMLHDYFSEAQDESYRPAADYLPDFAPDYYQAIRTTRNSTGSTVEKSDGLDKYELIANAQNGSNDNYQQLKTKYPESCWITQGYLNGSNNNGQNLVPFVLNYIRKVSVISGYNLTPYFERWGLLRSIAMYVGDYTSSHYLMPQDMLDEFRDDMAKLTDSDGNTLKSVDDEFVKKISNAPIPHYAKPSFPNDHAISTNEIQTELSK